MKILAIASIGGHWIQLLRLKPLFDQHEVVFVSTSLSLKQTLGESEFYCVPDSNRNNKIGLMKSVIKIFSLVLKKRPEVIITTGAAPGLIALFAGRLIGAKTVWIDSIANVDRLSMSGKIALKIADRVYTQWEHLKTPVITFAGNILQ